MNENNVVNETKKWKLSRKELEGIVHREEDKIFQLRQSIENFRIKVIGTTMNGSGYATLGEFYERFKEMNSCLHRQCYNNSVLDIHALVYAMQRLPEEITSAPDIYVKKEKDNLNGVEGIRKLNARLRRRSVYQIGQSVQFTAFEGETDILDLVSCMSMYGIEAKKIRNRLHETSLIYEINQYNNTPNGNSTKNQLLAKLASRLGVKFDDLSRADSKLGQRLLPIIGASVKHDIESVSLQFDGEFAQTDASYKSAAWSERVKREIAGFANRPIALVSSDNHSIVNCLAGFSREYEKEIVERAHRDLDIKKELDGLDQNDKSLLYIFLTKLCSIPENRDLLEKKIKYEESLGIRFLRDEHDTGVDVHILDVSKLAENPNNQMDSRLLFNRDKVRNSGLVLLNMDYSFGRQGYYNMAGLCKKLNTSIQSISLLGKAGITSIDGNASRFDIMLPTYIVNQMSRGTYSFQNGNGLTPNDFSGVFQGKIHTNGPMLTVPGTAMQTDLLLYYHMYWDNILGVEMEAGPYIEAIKEAFSRKQLRGNIIVNAGYWGSDEPCNPDASLSEDHMVRGSISSYALVLGTLNNILKSTN